MYVTNATLRCLSASTFSGSTIIIGLLSDIAACIVCWNFKNFSLISSISMITSRRAGRLQKTSIPSAVEPSAYTRSRRGTLTGAFKRSHTIAGYLSSISKTFSIVLAHLAGSVPNKAISCKVCIRGLSEEISPSLHMFAPPLSPMASKNTSGVAYCMAYLGIIAMIC